VASIVPDDFGGASESEFASSPIGTGPFKVAERQTGVSVEMVKNPSYWKPGQPHLDGLTYKVYSDPNALQTALSAGDVDIVNDAPLSALAGFSAGETVFGEPSGGTVLVTINPQGVLADVRVRQAMSLAIDREAMVAGVLDGSGSAAVGLLPPAVVPEGGQSSGEAYDFDPDRAKSLLADSDADGSVQLELTYGTGDATEAAIAQVIQSDLQKVGISVKLNPLDRAAAIDDIVSGKAPKSGSSKSGPQLARLAMSWDSTFRRAHIQLSGTWRRRPASWTTMRRRSTPTQGLKPWRSSRSRWLRISLYFHWSTPIKPGLLAFMWAGSASIHSWATAPRTSGRPSDTYGTQQGPSGIAEFGPTVDECCRYAVSRSSSDSCLSRRRRHERDLDCGGVFVLGLGRSAAYFGMERHDPRSSALSCQSVVADSGAWRNGRLCRLRLPSDGRGHRAPEEAAMNSATSPALSVSGLVVSRAGSEVSLVRGVTLDVSSGECLGVVGESGSGKSLTLRSLIGLLPRGLHSNPTSATVTLGGGDSVLAETIRGPGVGLILQDPAKALNPRMRVAQTITEPLRQHCNMDPRRATERVHELLGEVGIVDPHRVAESYPHQLSGGQRQRIAIAAALACEPEVLLFDEPTTALDVTTQAQIVRLLRRLMTERGLGLMFVSHDLGVVAQIADRVAVMYAGQIVETGPTAQVLGDAHHPYTRDLLLSVPRLTGPRGELKTIPGRAPHTPEDVTGCAFGPRCDFAVASCFKAPIDLEAVERGRSVRCVRWQVLKSDGEAKDQ